MKMTCDIIRDLLPLYHDGVCSEESKKIISEHIETCNACKEELRLMDSPIESSRIDINDKKIVKASSSAWKKRKLRSFIIGCIATVIIVGITFGIYIAVHLFSTAEGNDINSLTQQASNYFKTNVTEVLKVEQRENYLAVLFKSEDEKLGMCVFDKDSVFDNRWKADGGLFDFEQGEITSLNFGSSDSEAVLIICGKNLPKQANWYTFENNEITYTCPIKDGEVLDIFIIPDNNDINACPILLDENMQKV